jgi:hypothetical protein
MRLADLSHKETLCETELSLHFEKRPTVLLVSVARMRTAHSEVCRLFGRVVLSHVSLHRLTAAIGRNRIEPGRCAADYRLSLVAEEDSVIQLRNECRVV